MHRIRGKLTYANVMVTVLAFVVLGGSAYAAGVKLKANAVKTKNIAPGAVTSDKLAAGASIAHAAVADKATTADSAAHATAADTATSASNATFATAAATALNAASASSVEGVTPDTFFKTESEGTAATNVFSKGGFSVTLACSAAGIPDIQFKGPASSDIKTSSNGSGVGTYQEGDHDTGTPPQIDVDGANTRGSGEIEGATLGGAVLSGSFGFDNPESFSVGTNKCGIYGSFNYSA
jgi:hypothetical protein